MTAVRNRPSPGDSAFDALSHGVASMRECDSWRLRSLQVSLLTNCVVCYFGPGRRGWLRASPTSGHIEQRTAIDAARHRSARASAIQGRQPAHLQSVFDHSPWIEWNSINSEGALCGSLDRNVLLKTYPDRLRRVDGLACKILYSLVTPVTVRSIRAIVGSRCPTPQIGCRTGRHENQRAVLLDQPATALALTVNEALARSLSTEKAILQ